MTNDPFAAIRQALEGQAGVTTNPRLRLDPDRQKRTGIPEMVLAERKRVEDVASALRGLAQANGRALASRVRPDQMDPLREMLAGELALEIDPVARVVVAAANGVEAPCTGGRVAVACAGTSDLPIAREAAMVAREMGCAVREIADVGVAGLHRLVAPLTDLLAWEPHVIVVAAGMDGALPSVIAGLVPVPVIGLPVSVGYGYGGDGTAALMSMLQSCAPGLAVVNIDNGVGAGSMAALIANRAAQS